MDHLALWSMFSDAADGEMLPTNAAAVYPPSSDDTVVKREIEVAEEVNSQDVDENLETPSKPTRKSIDPIEGDDDAIFNFELEPQTHFNELHTAVSTPTMENDDANTQSSLENIQINYEDQVIYICPACGAEFDAQDSWKRHMNGVHSYNTRRGLNFFQVDKLYHECYECHKRIAMHSMENLLKHKFTHLPYRCTKCRICLRQYKYRQDLMVHLRMTHRENLLASNTTAQTKTSKVKSIMDHQLDGTPAILAIQHIKENALELYRRTNENVDIRSEVIRPDVENDDDDNEMNDQGSSSIMLASLLEDGVSCSSSHTSDRQGGGNANIFDTDEELHEKCILHVCPQCGAEFGTHTQWRHHILSAHDFGTLYGLNFKEVNMRGHAQCQECSKILFVHIPTLQLHTFSHLPYKSRLRCKLCLRGFINQKDINKHLTTQHRLGREPEADSQNEQAVIDDEDGDSGDQSLSEQASRSDERDSYEPHVDYLCPQCGVRFMDKKLWRKHIVKVHHLTNLSVLNFEVLNDRQLRCLECNKIITNAYGVQNAQQHRITHMPYKAFIRCRMCMKSYTDRKGLVKHLRSVHRIGSESRLSVMSIISAKPGLETYLVPRLTPALPPPLQMKHQEIPAQAQLQKEILKHADVTYEIQYLDDEESLDDKSVPDLSFSSTFDQLSHLKCADCGSIFPTQNALQTHMGQEHEFLDFNNLRPLTESPKASLATENCFYDRDSMDTHNAGQSRNKKRVREDLMDDKLLLPIGDEPSYLSSDADIERLFCYLCPACGVESKTQNEWRQHINEAHDFSNRHALNFQQLDKFRFRCTICNEVVTSAKLKGLQDHKFRHLPYRLYIKCQLCQTCYNHKPNMINHLKTRHDIFETNASQNTELNIDSPFHTRVNSRTASMSSSTTTATSTTMSRPPGLKTVEDSISYHNAVDHESITYFCPQCNENFDTHVFWRKHIVDEHNLNSRRGLNFTQVDEHHYLCLQCYKSVTVTHTKGAIGQLQSHKFRHLPYKSFKCMACNGEFVRKQMFFKHLNKNTNRCDSAPTKPINDEQLLELSEPPQDNNVIEEQPGINEDLIVNQASFALICPACGQEFGSMRMWREHINVVHQLGNRHTLRFKKINKTLHQCLDCNEQVSGNKLRDLQIHKFKHLKYGAYILQCKFCDAAYSHIRNMKNHLQQKHPNVVQKTDEYVTMNELQQYEEMPLNDTDNENNDDNDIENDNVDDEKFSLE